jgi:predicted flap endonuclease-1-like 5' DNA nuclease
MMTHDTDEERRQRLARRIAGERRQRETGAAARLQARTGGDAMAPAVSIADESDEDAAAALEAFLARLTGGLGLAATPEGLVPGARAVLPFQRPAPKAPAGQDPAADENAQDAARALDALAASLEAACDLERLPGAGPGLIWALRRAGVRRLSDLAALDRETLAARLGPLGLLVPLERWINTARAAARGAVDLVAARA